tara:strand:+ start:15247 stop:15480 length:234 start_codon:yes stop_codon:yes gene_type:complete
MSYLIGDLQQKALESFLSKVIKRHLRKFAKTTEMERSNFNEFLQDWIWSLNNNSEISRIYQAYEQLEGRITLIEIEF